MVWYRWACGFAAGVVVAGSVSVGFAESVAGFYQGKTVTVVISGGAGGSYALYGQLSADFMQKHIPGNPKLVPQFMPGGGGAKAANYLYNVASKDGTVIAVLYDTTALAQVLRPTAAKYDVKQMAWLGQFVSFSTVITVMAESGARTVADARAKELIMGSTGRSAPSFINMSTANAVAGTRFKIVTGYPDTASTELAMERGEVHGASAGWMNWKARHSGWLASGRLIPLIQVSLKRHHELPEVPTLIELTGNDRDRDLAEFVSAGGALGRTLAAPPGVPSARVEALRRAFDAMVADPEFLAAAKQRKLDIEPDTGEAVQALAERIVSVKPDVLERARTIFGAN